MQPAPTLTVTSGPILVLDPTGKPASGARLTYLALGREGEAALSVGVSGDDGRAAWSKGELSIPGLLRAEKEGFAPGDAPVARRDAETTVRLGAAFVLDGIVVRREDGVPIPGAEVRIQYDRHTGPLGPLLGVHGTLTASTRGGPDGTFRLSSLSAPSQALLIVTAEGYAEARLSWGAWMRRPVRVELERPLSLRVLLRDREGKPLPGGAVALGRDPRTLAWRDGFVQFAWVPLRDMGDGLYGGEGLSSGWYLAAGGHPGYRPADAGWIGLRAGGPPAEIVLEPAAGIRGRVVDDATGSPMAGARLWVMPFLLGEKLENTDPRNTREAGEGLGDAAGTVSGPDGEFALTGASPGDALLLWAVAEGHWPIGARVSSLGKESPFEVRMRPLGRFSVRGRIVDETGHGLAGALIRWEGVLGLPSGAASAGEDGRFSIDGLSGGQFPVALASGYFPTTLPALSAVKDGDYGDIALVRVREVFGKVVEAGGTPVPGLVVAVHPETESEGRGLGSPVMTRILSSDGAGALVVPLAGGTGCVLRPLESAPWTGEVRLTSDDPSPFTLVVAPKPPIGTGVVRGRAQREDGSLLAESALAMVWPEGAGEPAKGVQPARVAPDGAFAVEGIPAGSWKVVVQSSAVHGETHGVTLAEGGTAAVVVTCAPWPKKDPAEAPVELRLAPAGSEARALTGWITDGDRRSQPLRTKGEELVASVRGGRTYTAWVFDQAAGTAGLAPRLDVKDAMPITVSLGAAGRVVLKPSKDGAERWVVVRDAAGSVPWSGLETSLPGVPGKGYILVLPPGEYEFTFSAGLARRDPRTLRVAVRVGEEAMAE